jgi:hypothetical protein
MRDEARVRGAGNVVSRDIERRAPIKAMRHAMAVERAVRVMLRAPGTPEAPLRSVVNLLAEEHWIAIQVGRLAASSCAFVSAPEPLAREYARDVPTDPGVEGIELVIAQIANARKARKARRAC